ncbi:MAG: phage shock protein PspA [Pseudomonadales bacterium]|nr:phage shock protein PspA [Pseudomonadales bacterium]
MSVFSRLSDIINANLNAILDEAEDPEKMVRMITQEMEETLVEIRSMSARYLADKKQVAARIQYLVGEARAWESKAELAVSKGRDDLAKAALKEKSGHDEVIAQLSNDLNVIDESINKLKGDTGQLEEKLRHARARQKALILRGKTAKSRIRVKRQIHDNAYGDAMDRFEAYERRLDEMEGEIESYDLANTSLAGEIDSLEQDDRLDEELARLKARMQVGAATTTPEQVQ